MQKENAETAEEINMTWTIDVPQGSEAKKVIWETVPYTRGKGLDVGCGPMKLWPQSIGVDNDKDQSLFGNTSEADLKCSAEDMSIIANQSMDYVFSSHLLEHCEDYITPLKEMWRVLKQGGYLLLYLPDEDEYPKIGEIGCNPDHKWNVNYDKVVDAMKGVGSWDLVDFQKRNQGDEYSLYFVFAKSR